MTKTPEELTADWKAGKLKYGWYWVDNSKRGIVPDQYLPGYNWLVSGGSCIDKILAPCNYDEYKAMQEELTEFKRSATSYIGKPIDYDIACKTINKLLDDKQKIKAENEQLKKLLRECQYMILAYSINHDTFTKEKVLDVVKQIDNATGEKK